jgi:hypothetical protein
MLKPDWPVIEDPVICIPGVTFIGCSCWTPKGAFFFVREAINGVYNAEEIVNTCKNSFESYGSYLGMTPAILPLPTYVKIHSNERHICYRAGDSWLFMGSDLKALYKPTLYHLKDLSWFLPEGYPCLDQTQMSTEKFLWEMKWQIPDPLSLLREHTFTEPLHHLLLLLGTPE